jgi:hypothetical protein
MQTPAIAVETAKQLHKDRFGGFNSLPPNMKQVSERTFVQENYVQIVLSPKRTEFRQIGSLRAQYENKEIKLLDATLFFHETERMGVMLATSYYLGKVFYFTFRWEFEPPCELLDDSNWEMDTYTSRPQHGIRNFNRVLKFERDLNTRELQDVRYWLLTDNCPGWTGVNIAHVGVGVYKCHSLDDSS